jgi:hypothetical protein
MLTHPRILSRSPKTFDDCCRLLGIRVALETQMELDHMRELTESGGSSFSVTAVRGHVHREENAGGGYGGVGWVWVGI